MHLARKGPHGWYQGDFRLYGKGRIILRDPDTNGWPAAGKRTQDRGVAIRWYLRYLDLFREEARRQQLKLGVSPKRLGEACDEYIQVRRYEQRRPENTWQNDQAALNHLRFHSTEDADSHRRGDALLTSAITQPFLQRLFSKLLREGYAPSSVHGIRRGISGFLVWLGHGQDNAALACELPAVVRRPVHTWSAPELEDIRKAADECDRLYTDFVHHRRAVELALGCGGRRNELFALRSKNLRPETDQIRFSEQVHKSRPALVPLKSSRQGRRGEDSARTALLLPGWAEHIPVGGDGFLLPGRNGSLLHPDLYADLVVRVLVKAGHYRPRLGWHTFRHTYARDYLLLGGTLEQLQKALGHGIISTTQKYYDHFTPDDAQAAAHRKIYPSGSLVRLA